VTRARGGNYGITSVNEPCRHPGAWQRQRRLCHTTRVLVGNGTSCGRVTTRTSTDVDGATHEGHRPDVLGGAQVYRPTAARARLDPIHHHTVQPRQ
jgi:hypothetical protein